jgi:hypothetical protein
MRARGHAGQLGVAAAVRIDDVGTEIRFMTLRRLEQCRQVDGTAHVDRQTSQNRLPWRDPECAPRAG